MEHVQFNSNGIVPDWGFKTNGNLVTFYSKELSVKESVLIMDWQKCVKDLNIDISNPESIYNNLPNICNYFLKI